MLKTIKRWRERSLHDVHALLSKKFPGGIAIALKIPLTSKAVAVVVIDTVEASTVSFSIVDTEKESRDAAEQEDHEHSRL